MDMMNLQQTISLLGRLSQASLMRGLLKTILIIRRALVSSSCRETTKTGTFMSSGESQKALPLQPFLSRRTGPIGTCGRLTS